jgi:flagellar biosynthesis/type III secretory pathway protein FliH
MTFLLWQRDSEVGIASPRRVLRAAEVPLLADANDLCERLHSLYAAEAVRLKADRNEARERGYAAGHREGTKAANEAHVARLATLSAAAARQHEELGAQVAELALQVARKLIGSLAADERLVALAGTAARDLMPAARITLHVHPDQVDPVRARLALLVADMNPEPLPSWEVRGDADDGLDGCLLETELGTVDASLETQLLRLAEAWGIGADNRGAA